MGCPHGLEHKETCSLCLGRKQTYIKPSSGPTPGWKTSRQMARQSQYADEIKRYQPTYPDRDETRFETPIPKGSSYRKDLPSFVKKTRDNKQARMSKSGEKEL